MAPRVLDPRVVCESASSFDSYYSYPIVYYADGSGNISDSPIPGGVRVESYCINIGDAKIVVHSLGEESVSIVESVGGDVAESIDKLVSMLESGAVSFNNHEIKGISVLFMVDPEDVIKIIKYGALRRRLEDRYVALVGGAVYVFTRNPSVVLERIDDELAVEVAREHSIISRAPVKDIREHIKSFLSETAVVFYTGDASLWCDSNTCFPTRLPSNLVKLVLRDIGIRIVAVDLSRPRDYRRVELSIPGDYLIISSRTQVLKRERGRLRVEKTIPTPHIRTVSPLLFSKRGFVGYALFSNGRLRRVARRVVESEKEAEYVAML